MVHDNVGCRSGNNVLPPPDDDYSLRGLLVMRGDEWDGANALMKCLLIIGLTPHKKLDASDCVTRMHLDGGNGNADAESMPMERQADWTHQA